jgi:hypothetical protein
MLNRKLFTRDQVLDALDYLHHVRANNKGRRLNRTTSIVKELKAQNRKYFWTGFNTVYMESDNIAGFHKKIYIQGDVDCYRVRLQWWRGKDSDFCVREIEANNGNQLLWELVCIEWLDRSFLPTTKHITL